MKARELILSAAAMITLCAPSVFAQTTTSTATTTDPQSIAQRKDNQQDRIAQGIDSGQLTAGETKNLETKEADVNKEEHTMRTEDDGHLTAADRAKTRQSAEPFVEPHIRRQAQCEHRAVWERANRPIAAKISGTALRRA